MPEPETGLEMCRPIEAHCALVMAWRNDPRTLAASFDGAPKVWETFWPDFRDSYFSQSRFPPLFALLDGARIGFIRFRPLGDPKGGARRCVDISVNLAPEFRGRGLAAGLIEQAADLVRRSGGVDRIVAEIRDGNAGSVRAFEKAGFTSIGVGEKRSSESGTVFVVHRLVLDLSSQYWTGSGVHIIAEAGSNWRMGTPARDRAMARALIDVAVEAGADAVKFQTYRAETVYVGNAGQSEYLSDAGYKQDISDIFADLAMPYDMIPELAAYCREQGIAFMSTPFSADDFAAIDPHVNVHKIASYEISHPHLLRLAGASGKPLVLSTGASGEADIAWAVDRFRAAGGRDLCLLQCTAKYPAPLDQMNLSTIPWLQGRFGVSSGLSDHSRDPALAPVAAVALGARVIEKHYTLDNRLPGPDHSFALLPDELKHMVQAVRAAEQTLGDGVKTVLTAEQELADYARRGVQAITDIAEGEAIVEDVNVAVLRPGSQPLGVHPRYLGEIEGQAAARNIPSGAGIRFGDWCAD